MKVFWLLPLLAVALSAADVSGKWTGSIEVADTSSGTTVNTPVKAEFQQKEAQVSGTVARREDDEAGSIRNGRIENGKLIFDVSPHESAGNIRFQLTLVGDRLEGEMKGAIDTGPITGKVHLVRMPQ